MGSSQSPLSVSDFRNDIFGPYDGEIFLFFFFAFLSIFVCATSGTNVNDCLANFPVVGCTEVMQKRVFRSGPLYYVAELSHPAHGWYGHFLDLEFG